MYCEYCGNKIEGSHKFCTKCGREIINTNANAHSEQKTETPNLNHTSTHEHSSKNNFAKSNKGKFWLFGIIGVIILIFTLLYISGSSTNKNNISQSVVDVNCDNGKGGSGTIFTTDGIVLTNNHVITGSKSCEVTIPDPTTGQISEIYEASPVIVPTLSKKYDVATLKIDGAYTDSNGKTWGTYPTTFTPFTLPSTCDQTSPSKLGDSVTIYGYPITSGGYNLTITTGVISSFADNGEILTSAQVDSGNSGGLAVDQNGCWLGIPSAVESGNYQNLGVIIPGSEVESFINAVPAKPDPAATNASANLSAEAAATPKVSNNQQCQNEYGTNSVWSGQKDSSGNPTCECQTGYSWDATGNSCALQTSLDQDCQNSYGSESYSYPQDGKAMCGCSTGYTWNSDQTECVVQETGYQVCSDEFPNETWDGTYASDGDYNCVCQSGYSSYDGQCVSSYTYCTDTEGYAASYDAGTNSCTCDSGYVYNNGQCEEGGTYCSERWGVGAEYDYSGGGCECEPGYESNGSECVYSGY